MRSLTRGGDLRLGAWEELSAVVRRARAPTIELADAAPPVRRYFDRALGTEPRPAVAAVLQMTGQIKIGRWLPFRARQLLAPRHGSVWQARIAGIISGGDRYVAGAGGMDWRLFGLAPVMRASGLDVSRSSAERAAGESIWIPAAIPPPSATWIADDATHVRVQLDVDGHEVTIRHVLDGLGRLRSSSFDRWGDPDKTGRWRPVPFGVEVTAERTFEGITIPSQGRAGWHFGTDRWTEGEFFRFTITKYRTWP